MRNIKSLLPWLLLIALAIGMSSCAKTPTIAKVFPDFVAVVAQSGDTASSLAREFLGDELKGWVILDYNKIRKVEPGMELIIPTKPVQPGGLRDDRYVTVPVITYHQFTNKPLTKRQKRAKMFVRQKDFEAQMKYLYDNNFNVVTMKDFVDFLEFKGDIPDKAVIITIDDGFKSVYDYAFPVLKKYGFPATFFIYTDLIEKEDITLDWNEIRAMDADGLIDVQCHTRSHRDLRFRHKNNDFHDKKLRNESFEEYFASILEQFTSSGDKVFKELNKQCEYLAYPYGGTNHMVIAMAKKFGYRAAFTINRGSNAFFAHNFRLRRDMIYGDYSLAKFKKIVNRTYGRRALK